MGFLDKVKAEAKRVENRAKKEKIRVVNRLEDKVEAEIGRVEDKFSPANMFKDINYSTLTGRLKLALVKYLNESLEITTQWAAEEIVASKSKLDDFVLPLIPSIEEEARKLIARIK